MRKANILVFVILFFLSCNVNSRSGDDGFYSDNKNVKTEMRNVPDFTEIKSSGSVDVLIIAGNKFEVKAQDNESSLYHLITEVKEGVLNIYYDENTFLQESNGRVTVEVPALNKISSSGSGDIKMEGTLKNDKEIIISSSGSGDVEGNVDAPSIRLSNAGSGDVKLKGNTKNFNVSTVGSGDVKCRELKSENAVVTLAGSSDVAVYASVSLKVNITGSGDVTYSGNPSSPQITTQGSGEARKVQ